MEFRWIFIANPAYLFVRKNQLVIRQEQDISVPMEDISSILIESRAVTITAAALQLLTFHGVTVYFCDETHLPAAVALPIDRGCRQLKLLNGQISMSQPLKKRVWQTVVQAKILNQAACLELLNRPNAADIRQLSAQVRSGDPDNFEATAAALYFPSLYGPGFTRSQDCIRNAALNYGYSILRGAVARNLVMRGLEPCLGIFHHNELNSFNLADDLMEPYRPLVDLYVASAISEKDISLTPQIKQQLFNLSNYLIEQDRKNFRAISAVGRMVDSFARIIQKTSTTLEVPHLLPLQVYEYE